MRKLLVILFSLICSITYSQGVGYLNYVTYLTHNNTGTLNQYPQFANSATDFVNMFNTANSNTTIYSQGVGSAAHTLVVDGSYVGGIPNGGQYFGVKIDGYFIPKETGTYTFGINSDDGSDLLINGAVVTSYYGGHGMGGYRTGSIQLTAGVPYRFMARFQQYGGGWGMMVAWKRPSQSQLALQPDEVSTIGSTPSKQGRISFDFGSTLDKTKFAANGTLSSTGWADITNAIDSVKVGSGYKGTVTPGTVEWVYMDYWNGTTYIHIDGRKLGNAQPTDVTQVKMLDLYEGPVTFFSWDGTWATYIVPNAVTKLTDGTSAYNSLIRPFNGHYYALSCDISFAANQQYKPQSVTITTTNTLSTLYNSIVTVSDVYLAFKEYSNQGGLFGNGSNGGQFTYGIQYKNADVNDDGVFDEKDCYALLQNLTGAKSLIDTMSLRKTLKLIPTSTYNTIGVSNWNTFSNYLGDTYNFDINTSKAIDTFYLSATWKGDVNLSHSATPASNGITTMSLKTMSISTDVNFVIDEELVGDSVVMTLKLNPLQQQVVGAQFLLTFDNAILNYSSTQFVVNGSPTNFSKLNTNTISIGSLNTSGGILDNTTTYKISFKPTKSIDSILGLVSISNTEAINMDGKNLNVKIY